VPGKERAVPDLISLERIENKIYLVRGQKVMLDSDLAELYGVSTGRLNEQVKRNLERFPDDFMFSLTRQEILRISQIAISSSLKFSKNVNAFTENGVAMLSSVLRSKRAIQVNILIMRTFNRLRHFLFTHKELAQKFKELDGKHQKHDAQIQAIFKVIREMMAPTSTAKRRIGFLREEGKQ
jgi:hypothetical protein